MSEPALHIAVDITQQSLRLRQGAKELLACSVSTAKNGPGELADSECTPRGRHRIAEKIGANCPLGTVFVGRQATGEIYSAALEQAYPDRDWILTRILWLAGTEPGKNKGADRDSYARYIYIHGSPDEVAFGIPGSRGCIRMAQADILSLFAAVSVGTTVVIT